MKFGKVDNPEEVDFTIPKDHKDTKAVLEHSGKKDLKVYVGCAKWNRKDLKGFYPRGTKNELEYYSSQFNSIELNATFYRLFAAEQFTKWGDTTPEGFKFFPKLGQDISHWRRLQDVEQLVEDYINNASHMGDKLGTIFLQLHSNFAPEDLDRVRAFVKIWKYDTPLLSAYFIEKLNKKIGTDLAIPKTLETKNQN